MESLVPVTFAIGVAAYSVASTLFFVDLVRRPGRGVGHLAPKALTVAALLHLLHIVMASLVTRVCPVVSIHFALSVSGLVAVTVFLLVRARRSIDALGVAVAPVALTFLVASQFIFPTYANPEISRTLLSLHVTANLVGLGFVLLAGAASGFYVVTERRLKQKRLTAVGKLPSLDSLDRVGHRLLLYGFPLLTFGVVTGGIFFSQIDVDDLASVVRAVLGYVTWAVVAAVLLLRALFGWRGRKSAWGTLVGVCSVTLVLVVYVLRPLLGSAL